MQQRIVLFGGTFDPVHHGHLIAARAAAEACGFRRVTLLPSATPPHKPPAGASAEQRLAMLRLAVGGEPLFDVCDIEINRTGPSYTLDTLNELRSVHGPEAELRLLIGADMLEDLPGWHRAGEVVELARFTVVARPPWDQRMESVLERLAKKFPAAKVRELRDSIVLTPLVEISSSDIRRRVREGRSIRYLVPPAVEAYIAEQGLYRR